MEPFTGLGPREIEAALERGITLADQEIERAVAAGRAQDTSEVLRRLVLTARHARAAYGRSAALWTVHPDPATRAAAGDALSRLEAWQAATFARADLYDAIAFLGRELTSAPLLGGVAQALEAARTAMGAASASS